MAIAMTVTFGNCETEKRNKEGLVFFPDVPSSGVRGLGMKEKEEGTE